MGYYSDYLNQNMDFNEITYERKKLLKEISNIRNNNAILVIASDITSAGDHLIEYSDILSVQDQISNIQQEKLDIILESNGGHIEVVEDLVLLIRKYISNFSIIIPGSAKSASTIFTMAANEILMGESSSLGPIDTQVEYKEKRFSADAFLEGFQKIKQEILDNPALSSVYAPILQGISPGEIQQCTNTQMLSQSLVTKWLQQYHFSQSSNNKNKAEIIAQKLCRQSEWYSHARSIKINDLRNLGLSINDYTEDDALKEAITRYYILLRMTFECTNIYKVFETPESHIYKHIVQNTEQLPSQDSNTHDEEIAVIDFQCPSCKNNSKIQANLDIQSPLKEGHHPYPSEHNNFVCPHCNSINNITSIKIQIESQTGKKVL